MAEHGLDYLPLLFQSLNSKLFYQKLLVVHLTSVLTRLVCIFQETSYQWVLGT